MPTVIPVRFKYAARDLWFNPKNTGAQEADHVICSTERGTEIGIATGDAREVSERELKETIGNSHLSSIIRIATDRDLDLADTLAHKGDEALPVFRQLVSQSELDMKPVGVEYLFGGEKVVCYFSAEERVDFRQLVRDLSHALHQRIDMRQIGVREEAAIVGGYGHCGQELCCRRFGLSFEPVSIRMAKEQDLPLNSSKISGACGRLMCCLRYEFEAYRDFKSRAPKRNAVIDTPLGKAKIVEYDTPKEEICLRIENGKTVRIPLAEMVPSEAAKKKSEELGCACRPDTVVRASLDKLNSPDVQMALAELDRRSGVAPAETFDESDLFVETKPRRRGRHKQEGASEGKKPDGEQNREVKRHRQRRYSETESAANETQARRRHHRTSEAVVGHDDIERDRDRQSQQQHPSKGADAHASQGPASPQQAGTRRRHHRSGESPTAPNQARASRQNGGNRGQRTRNGGSRGPKAGGSTAPREAGNAGTTPRHMRRPGDHGGSVAPKDPRDSRPHGMRPRRHRNGRNNGGAAGAGNGSNGGSGGKGHDGD